MTTSQERSYTEEYQARIARTLAVGTEEAFRELSVLCGEERFRFLSVRNKAFLLLGRVMQIWEGERRSGVPQERTMTGRALLMSEAEDGGLALKELLDVYVIVRFAIFRAENGLPEEAVAEGAARILVLGISPEAVILTARMEAERETASLEALARSLRHPALRERYGGAERMAAVLEDYLRWRESGT